METTDYFGILLWLISIILSGFAGAFVSIIYYHFAEKKRMKINTLKDFFGYRYDEFGGNFQKALNEIFIVFAGSKETIDALKEFHTIALSKDKSLANEKLKDLAKAMCRDVGIDINKVNEEFFMHPMKFQNKLLNV